MRGSGARFVARQCFGVENDDVGRYSGQLVAHSGLLVDHCTNSINATFAVAKLG